MPLQYPLRSRSHQIDERGERFVRNILPHNWTCEKTSPDYGVDLRIDIFEGIAATGLELLIQLKSSSKPSNGDSETVCLKIATYNYLSEKLQVVMLVKFVEEENEAYWLLFKDIKTPNPNKKTFTVHIPRSNRLSTIDWLDIQRYVRRVTDIKIAARRKAMLTADESS